MKTMKNAIVEYLDYQIPVTQLKGRKEMEICKQQSEIEKPPPTGGRQI